MIILGEERNYEDPQGAVLYSLLSLTAVSLCTQAAPHDTASSISEMICIIIYLYETGTERWHSVRRGSA
jgi:hypothetical protein